jgi:plasmid stabilization system protein ParE
MKTIRIRPQALREYVEASTWYETQSRGLGIQFEREVEKTLISIGQTPLRYAIVAGEVRCAPVTRFPYAVYFRILPRSIAIIAIYHQSRDPAGWQSRS